MEIEGQTGWSLSVPYSAVLFYIPMLLHIMYKYGISNNSVIINILYYALRLEYKIKQTLI